MNGSGDAPGPATVERLRVLASVSHAFAMVATDYGALLQLIARSTADFIGDGCLVTMVDGDYLQNTANAHRDPALEADYATFTANVRLLLANSASVSAQVARSGVPKLAFEISPEAVAAASETSVRPIARRLNVHSYAVVPIRVRGTILGTLSALRSGPGRGYTHEDVLLLQDLADRAGLAIENARLYHDLEERVRTRTLELEATNRELEAFSYSIAHDLRAPLRTIQSFSRALIEDHAAQLDAPGMSYLERVLGASRHMSTLIDDLLDLSRVTSADLVRQRTNVTALAEAVIARLRANDPERDVEVVVQPDLFAYADPRLLEIVLANLLGNAWKFTSKRPRGRIRVTAQHLGSRPIEFSITDDGAGFEPTAASAMFRVFQRFHLASDFEGTGIGLATVQRILTRHGGQIRATGAVDRGATFTFTLEP